MVRFEGGCQCGAVRYEASVDRLIAYVCHCRECQQQSASAFGISVPISRERMVIKGPVKAWRRPTDSGFHINCWFCETCGSRVYHQGLADPSWISIKGGSLDRPDLLTPIAHIWVTRKRPWVLLPSGMTVHETQPDDFLSWLAPLTPPG